MNFKTLSSLGNIPLPCRNLVNAVIWRGNDFCFYDEMFILFASYDFGMYRNSTAKKSFQGTQKISEKGFFKAREMGMHMLKY